MALGAVAQVTAMAVLDQEIATLKMRQDELNGLIH
jgi:hypothetical protein